MEDKIDRKILLDFAEGKYSWNDYLKIRRWFENPDDFSRIKEILSDQLSTHVNSEQNQSVSLDGMFEKMQYEILLEEKKKGKKRNIWHFYRLAAAILLVPVLIFSGLIHLFPKNPQIVAETWAEINAPLGARVEFMLPDSSSGWLNSGAKLKYPVVFGAQRKVELTGEAYFDVKHRNNSDFTVAFADLNVRVFGTKFNVSAYGGDEFIEVVLEQGKVELSGMAGQFNYSMQPNEKVIFNRATNSVNAKKVESGIYTAWKDGYLILDNEPLGEAAVRIERWYNAEIVIQNELLKKYRFKATFRDEPIEEVFRLLALTTPIRYTIERREVNQKGVFNKKKVTIKLR
jgi:transmembrane sensor